MDNAMMTHLGALASARERKAMSLAKSLVCCLPSCQYTRPLQPTSKFSPFLLRVLVPVLFLLMSSARLRRATTEEVQFFLRGHLRLEMLLVAERFVACLVFLSFFGTIALYAQKPVV